MSRLRIVLAASCVIALGCDDDSEKNPDTRDRDHGADHDHDHDSDHAIEEDSDHDERDAGVSASDHDKPKDAGTDAASSDLSLPDPDAPPVTLDGKKLYAVRFDIRAGSQSIRCGGSATVGTKKTKIQPVDLRFFVHDVALVRARGERVPLTLYQDDRWQRDNVALLDFVDDTGMCETGNKEIRNVVYGYADAHDDYTSVAFNVGVPEDKNHLDAARAPAPYNSSGLWWSWSSGYKYMRIDVSSEEQPIWYFHGGATSCSGTLEDGFKCGSLGIAKIALPDFNPQTSIVVFDLEKFYSLSDLTVGDDTPGCMGFKPDTQCAPLYATLGMVPWDDAAKAPDQIAFALATGDAFQLPNHTGPNRSSAHEDPTAWPNPSFERPTVLDVMNISRADEMRSHAPEDARYNVNCMRCHQEHGPGLGRFTAAGTLTDANGKPGTGHKVEIFSGAPSRESPEIADFKSQAILDVDMNGNFFTTQTLPFEKELGARILGSDGKVVMQMPFVQPTSACNTCHTGSMRLRLPKH